MLQNRNTKTVYRNCSVLRFCKKSVSNIQAQYYGYTLTLREVCNTTQKNIFFNSDMHLYIPRKRINQLLRQHLHQCVYLSRFKQSAVSIINTTNTVNQHDTIINTIVQPKYYNRIFSVRCIHIVELESSYLL